MQTSEEAQALPTLRSWMAGLSGHPLHQLTGPPVHLVIPEGVTYRWWRDPVLTILDDMLGVLERANPHGLSHLQRRFRELGGGLSARDDLYRLRAEIVVATWLAEHGVPFRVNTGAGPDFLLPTSSGREVGIEVSTRVPQSLGTVAADIQAELERSGVSVKVQLFAEGYPPVSIRADARQRIFDRAVQGALSGSWHSVFHRASDP
jgi:hypothetical protein